MRNEINIVETKQLIEIKDNLEQFKYRIEYKVIDHVGYKVEVINLKTKIPTLLFSKTYTSRSEAEDVFEHKKHEYLIYVKSHMVDLEDINLYKEYINYHEIDDNSCKNCAFCHHKDHSRMECWNKENFVFQDYMKDQCDKRGCDIHNNHPDHNKHFLNIHPEVKPNCICDNYIRFVPKPYPYHDCECTEQYHYNNMYDTCFNDNKKCCGKQNDKHNIIKNHNIHRGIWQ